MSNTNVMYLADYDDRHKFKLLASIVLGSHSDPTHKLAFANHTLQPIEYGKTDQATLDLNGCLETTIFRSPKSVVVKCHPRGPTLSPNCINL